MIPEFDRRGLLPPGDYAATFEQLRKSVLVHGTADHPVDAGWRGHLVDQAEKVVRQLWALGISEVYLDGSFVESKEHPNDIDGYFHVDVRRLASGDFERQLNALDPHKVWTWDHAARRQYHNYSKKQLPMWHQYRVELYPHYPGLVAMSDRHGNPLQFPAAFRLQRDTDQPKGIVRLTQAEE